YVQRDPIGAGGDFVTAPEISQIFGELIGLWCAHSWEQAGRPDPVILVELGPGRGTMMIDLLRAAAAVPEFRRALRVHLVEASPVLRAEQERRLGHASPTGSSRGVARPEADARECRSGERCRDLPACACAGGGPRRPTDAPPRHRALHR